MSEQNDQNRRWMKPKNDCAICHNNPYPKLTPQEVENYPLGYPRQAAFADSDESFMLYRRFGNVHARLLLHQQDELREMEEKLHDLDLLDNFQGGSKFLKCRELDEERPAIADQESRPQLLERMREKTMQYGRVFFGFWLLLLIQFPQKIASNMIHC